MTTFGRVIEVQIRSKVFQSPPLAIEFDVPFSDSSDANVASVQLVNLSQESIAVCEQDSPVAIRAGYRGDTGIIALGVIEEVVTQIEGANKVTTLTVGDGTDKWLSRYVNRSWSPGVNASQIVNDLVSLLGLDIGQIDLPTDVTYPSGRTFSMGIKPALEELAADTGAKLHIRNGAVFIIPPGRTQQELIVLSADTGLLDSPYVDTAKEDAYRVKMLLQHRITTDSLVEIQSSAVRGRFRVAEGRHLSDESEHVTECVVVPV